jgi:hypothetical protein
MAHSAKHTPQQFSQQQKMNRTLTLAISTTETSLTFRFWHNINSEQWTAALAAYGKFEVSWELQG